MGRISESFHDLSEEAHDLIGMQLKEIRLVIVEIQTDLEYLLQREKYYMEKIERGAIEDILASVKKLRGLAE